MNLRTHTPGPQARAALPRSVKPMLASLTRAPFDSRSHLFELKWDGVRAIAFIERGAVRIQSRDLRDITSEFPEMAEMAESVRAESAVLDGEIVVFGKDGHPSLSKLQERMRRQSRGAADRGPHATFVAFDVLYLNGKPVTTQPLVRRKALLGEIVRPGRAIQPCEFIENDGIAFFKATCDLGLEGIVAKSKSSIYMPGRRSPHWMKIKRRRESDFVVGGYDIGGKRALFSSLLLGLYDERAKLRYVGEVSAGFSPAESRLVNSKLQQLQARQCAFDVEPEVQGLVYWCKPELVCRVEYGEFTERGQLRYTVYVGVMDDKSPDDCLVEEAPGWPRDLIT